MAGLGSGCWDVGHKPLVDCRPVNGRVLDSRGGDRPLDRTEDGGGIGPDGEEIRTDPLLHLHHPLLLGLLGVVDVGRGQGLYGIKELGDLLGVGDELGDFLGVRDELGDLLGVGEGLLTKYYFFQIIAFLTVVVSWLSFLGTSC